MKKNIALLAGGYSGEYEISIKTAVTIANNLDANLYNVFKIIVTKESWLYTADDGHEIAIDKNDFSLTINSEKIKFDAVFIAIHGTPGEDGKIQGLLEFLNISYNYYKKIEKFDFLKQRLLKLEFQQMLKFEHLIKLELQQQ